MTLNERHYRVFLRGENFLLDTGGGTRKYGFYTTRFVTAPDEDAAELAAIELIRDDADLHEIVLNERDDSPMIYAESVEPVSADEVPILSGSGFTFYPEDGDADGSDSSTEAT